jgi:formylglycine-generating enzyme required for sulfatase activity
MLQHTSGFCKKNKAHPASFQFFFTVLLAALCLGLTACSETAHQHGSAPGTDMARIPAGEFSMGSAAQDANADEKPVHTVYVSAFFIDRFEVTNAQYRDFILATGHSPPRVEAAWAEPYNWTGDMYPPGTGNNPVVLVSWHDAVAYAAWADKRLPTEAEWEKAARSGLAGKVFPYGDTIEASQANFFISYLRARELRPVGSFKPNAFGLYDMAGNVWEWCRDWYSPGYYRKSAAENPAGPLHGENKVFRGGSWKNDKQFLRCAQRGKNSPDYKSPVVGFRCARSADQSAASEGSDG